MQTDERQTQIDERQANIFRMVAGCVMAGAILFGVLELLNIIHV